MNYPNLDAWIAAAARAENAIIEHACEMSLLDPEQRGVKIDRATGEVSLSPEVPWGTIHDHSSLSFAPLWMAEP